MTVRHVYYDFDVALALVAAGQGIGMLPALALQGDLPVPAQTPSTTTSAPESTSGDLPVPAAPAETEAPPADSTMMMAPAADAPSDTEAAPTETPSTQTGN